ncbi:MAG: hypothetical protein JKY42_08265 [Flavobacteriales bacterium]|nr:hypothetical protein [Flavobacteriales bacterium]
MIGWQLKDDFYLWRVVSVIPSIGRKFYISNKVTMLIDIGPAFNAILYSRRYTFNEVGAPYQVMPSFNISVIL